MITQYPSVFKPIRLRNAFRGAAVAILPLISSTALHAQQTQPNPSSFAPKPMVEDSGPAALAAAAFFGDAAAVSRLLAGGVKPDANYGSAKPLQIAAERGYEKVAALLIESGAHVDAVDNMGDTALSAAAANGHTKVVQVLIDHGASLEQRNLDGWKPLSWAISFRKMETTKLLIQAGADVKPVDGDGQSVLTLAILYGADRDLLGMLLAKGADPVEQAKDRALNAFAAAGAVGSVEALRLFIERTKASPTLKDRLSDALHHAADNGRLEAVKYLTTKTEVDLNRQLDDSFGGVETLGGPDAPVTDGFTALSRAVGNGHDDIVRLLVNEGARIEGRTRPGDPLLSFAIKRNRNDWVELFLAHKAPLDAVDFQGTTALMVAADMGDVKLTQELIVHGASILHKNGQGMTALHFAANSGHAPIVALLLTAGALPGEPDNSGKTPLSYAKEGSHQDTIDLLMKAIQQNEKKSAGK